MLHPNVGGFDRALRLVLGALLFLGGIVLLSGAARLGVTLAVLGGLALLTGMIRFCALYIPFGISTAPPGARLSCGDEGGKQPMLRPINPGVAKNNMGAAAAPRR